MVWNIRALQNFTPSLVLYMNLNYLILTGKLCIACIIYQADILLSDYSITLSHSLSSLPQRLLRTRFEMKSCGSPEPIGPSITSFFRLSSSHSSSLPRSASGMGRGCCLIGFAVSRTLNVTSSTLPSASRRRPVPWNSVSWLDQGTDQRSVTSASLP